MATSGGGSRSRNRANYSQVATIAGVDDDDDDDVYDDNDHHHHHNHQDGVQGDDGIEMVGLVGDDGDEDFHDEPEEDEDHLQMQVDRKAVEEQSRIIRQRFNLDVLEEQLLWNVWNRWEEPALLSITVTTILLLPTLVVWLYGAFAFVGRFWSLWIFVLPLQFRMWLSLWYIRSLSAVSFKHRQRLRILCSLMTVVEVVFLLVYHALGKVLTEAFFRDADGSVVVEWEREVRFLRIATMMSWLVILSRCAIGLPCIAVRSLKHFYPDTYREWRPTFWTPGRDESLSDATRTSLQWIFRGFIIVVLGVHLVCILSAASHFGPWPLYHLPETCDPLDETECGLPFPSFHHMEEDPTSNTGWRVHLRGLPPLRGGIPFHPRFLNDLDGFSTSEWDF